MFNTPCRYRSQLNKHKRVERIKEVMICYTFMHRYLTEFTRENFYFNLIEILYENLKSTVKI